MTHPTIKPEVGRHVHYIPDEEASRLRGARRGCGDDVALAAIITRVLEDGRVNLAVFAPDGIPHAAINVRLMSPGCTEAWDGKAFARWMPYQVKQATGPQKATTSADLMGQLVEATAARDMQAAASDQRWLAERRYEQARNILCDAEIRVDQVEREMEQAHQKRAAAAEALHKARRAMYDARVAAR